MASTRRLKAILALGAVGLYALGGAGSAGADPIGAGSASAFAIEADVFGTEVIPPTPTSATTAPAAGETPATVIDIPGDPLVVSGTLIARSAVHTASDLPSELTLAKQGTAGPYNARAIGQIEDLSVLMNEQIPDGGKLISADVIRAEAVAVCSGNAVQYSAASEVVDLRIGGDTSFNGPLNDLVTQISEGIHASPLADLVDVELNVVTPLPNGVSVDAIVITVLGAAADNGAPGPLAKVVLGHAEVSGGACAAAVAPPECSDRIDNADLEDTLIDALDPGCWTDGVNPLTYDPNDDDERNEVVMAAGALPKDADAVLPAFTGGVVATGLAAALGIGALGLLALRRRLT